MKRGVSILDWLEHSIVVRSGGVPLELLSHLLDYKNSMNLSFHELTDHVGPIAKGGWSDLKKYGRRDKPDVEGYDLCAKRYFPELECTLQTGETVRFFSTPKSGADAERGSMLYHASLWKDGIEIVPSEHFLEHFSASFPSTKFVHPLKKFDECFANALANVVEHSSPGASMVLGSDNGQIIKNQLPFLQMIVFERLIRIASTPWEEMKHFSSIECVEGGYVDVVTLFIKAEVLKWSKMYDKKTGKPLPYPRYRLISNVSLVDQIIARMLHTVQNKTEIKGFDLLSSMPGFGCSSDLSVNRFAAATILHAARRQLLPKDHEDYLDFRCIDFQAWDWSVKYWELMVDAYRRRYCCNFSDDLLILKTHFLMANNVFCLSNGELWCQTKKGLMKSGWFNTSSSNSAIRASLSKIFFGLAHWVIAMGDDSGEDDHKDIDLFCEWINQIVGQTIPEDDRLKCSNGAFEFCSHVFLTEFSDSEWSCKAVILTWIRCIAKFAYSPKKSPDQIIGILNAMRHSPHLERAKHYFSTEYPDLYRAAWAVMSTIGFDGSAYSVPFQ